jgi:hypothetical protein
VIGRPLSEQLEIHDGDPDAVAKVRTLVPRFATASEAEIVKAIIAAPVIHGYRVIKTTLKEPAPR